MTGDMWRQGKVQVSPWLSSSVACTKWKVSQDHDITLGPIILQHDMFQYSIDGQRDIIMAIAQSGKRFVSMKKCLRG
jgi:hypothetical protein